MPKNVVIVDDSKTILATVQMALEEMVDAGVISFRDYLNPLEFLQDLEKGAVDFDLLIADINMPQMSGLDVARRVKANAQHCRKPLLILTTESSAEMKMAGKEIGVTGWMVKPFSDEKLVKSIKMLLEI